MILVEVKTNKHSYITDDCQQSAQLKLCNEIKAYEASKQRQCRHEGCQERPDNLFIAIPIAVILYFVSDEKSAST